MGKSGMAGMNWSLRRPQELPSKKGTGYDPPYKGPAVNERFKLNWGMIPIFTTISRRHRPTKQPGRQPTRKTSGDVDRF